jgi:hypothetical protein
MVSDFLITTRDKSLEMIHVDAEETFKATILRFEKSLGQFSIQTDAGGQTDGDSSSSSAIELEEEENQNSTQDRRSREQKHLAVHDSWAKFTIIIGAAISIMLGLMHHIFLVLLTGKPISSSQFWIKTFNNAFSQVLAISLGLTISGSITQAVGVLFLCLADIINRQIGLAQSNVI